MNRNWVQSIPTPEAYWMDRVLYETQHSPEMMAKFRADPDAYCRDMPLSARSKDMIVRNDIGQLYLAGTNPYLLRAHCLGLGVPEDEYLAALRAVEGSLGDG